MDLAHFNDKQGLLMVGPQKLGGDPVSDMSVLIMRVLK